MAKITGLVSLWVFLSILPGAGDAGAEDKTVYPTRPGTSIRDYSEPGYKIEGENIYPTRPGTSIRDYSKPGYKIEGDNIYPTRPGTSIRDYSKPGYRIDQE